MSIRLNEDQELVALIREGLKQKDGYCLRPSRMSATIS